MPGLGGRLCSLIYTEAAERTFSGVLLTNPRAMRTPTTLLSVLVTTTLFAQSPYRPFPESNAGWVESHSWLMGEGSGFTYYTAMRTIAFANDTSIAGTVYHQLRSRGEGTWQTTIIPFEYGTFTEPDVVFVRFRQDTDARKVYAYDILLQQEVLWYDFTLGLGDYPPTYDQQLDDGTIQVVALDSMELNDGWHRTWVLAAQYQGNQQDSAFCTIIEGVGSTLGLRTVYGLTPPFEWGDNLNCHSVNDYTTYPFGDSVCDLTMAVDAKPATVPALACFPNPASRSVTLIGNVPQGTRYDVFNGCGVLVLSGTLRSNSIDVGSLAPGPYAISTRTGDGTPLGIARMMKE